MDILDEKFAVTAFIARLGVQSKDLMFSVATKKENEAPRDKQTGTDP